MKIGLVLPGGGGKGAYQIGVIKALEELGIKKHIKYLSGTSIGALNSMLFILNNQELSESIWNNLCEEKILPVDNLELVKKGFMLTIGAKNINFIKKYIPSKLQQGNLSRDSFLELAERYIDVEAIKQSGIKAYAACTEVENLNVRYFRYNECDFETIKKVFLATSAIPSVYEPEEIEGKFYIDGGVVDNVPIQPLYGEGCDIIIVAHLSRDININREDFPNTKIIEIVPSFMEEGMIKGTLNFSKESCKSRMVRGYDDTKRILEPIIELALFCSESEKRLVSRAERIKSFFYKLGIVNNER
ncbi:MAG: patatin-like phospholipase family protein [Sarcina sp.]